MGDVQASEPGDSGKAVVIVGIDGWKEYTLPAIESIQRQEPDIPIIVIDNASEPPYPKMAGMVQIQRSCYAAAINHGLRIADADWTIVLNNDVICNGPFTHILDGFNPRILYGNQLIVFGQLAWLGGWLYAIPRHVRETIGDFDEQFEVCGFEDADYCFRAAAASLHVAKSYLPFTHLWGKTRWGIEGYDAVRSANLRRLEAKHDVRLGDWTGWKVYN